MAIVSGIPMTLTVDDSSGTARDIADNISNLTVNTPVNLQDITTLGKSAMARLELLEDLSVNLNGFLDTAANKIFAVLANHKGARTTAMGVSGKSLTAEVFYTDFNLSRNADGSIAVSCPGSLADGTAPRWA